MDDAQREAIRALVQSSREATRETADVVEGDRAVEHREEDRERRRERRQARRPAA